MSIQNKYRTLIWIIIILIATNLSMGITFLYHKQQDKQILSTNQEQAIEVPTQQRTRFFREQLDLQPQQMEIFRELNRNFNHTAWEINQQLKKLRTDMILELGKESPNRQELNNISQEIGSLHTQLKTETIDYYLSMSTVCTPLQKEKLNKLFLSILKKSEGAGSHQHRGRRQRGNRHFNNN